GTALLSIVLNLVFIPAWGLAGAAIAAAAATAFGYAAQAIAVQRIGVPVSLRSSALPVLLAATAAGLLWGLGGGLAARGCAGAGFLVACVLLGVVRPSEFKGLLPR